MKLIVTFSARTDGNCGGIAEHIAAAGDSVVHFCDLDVHPCRGCAYQCFSGGCPYREDAVFSLYASMLQYDKVVFIVPLYCGNPSALYFIFNERGQDYFMSRGDTYGEIIKRLHIIGIYGDDVSSPDFIPCLEKWFVDSPYSGRVLGIQRHVYGQKIEDRVLDVAEVRKQIEDFIG